MRLERGLGRLGVLTKRFYNRRVKPIRGIESIVAPSLFKVLVLADSLAMPRLQDGISYESTYPLLLQEHLRRTFRDQSPLIIEKAKRSRTIVDVVKDWDEEVVVKQAQVLIVHVGITDCAPRVFLPNETEFLLTFLPQPTVDAIFAYVHEHRPDIIGNTPRVYVKPEEFRNGVRTVVRKAKEANLKGLLFINILTPSRNLQKRSPHMDENVREYNHILTDECRPPAQVIDVNTLLGAECLLDEGIHFNRKGHEILASELNHYLQTFIEISKPAG